MPKSTRSRALLGTSFTRQRPAAGMIDAFVLMLAFVAVHALSPLTPEALAQEYIHSDHAPGQALEPLLNGSEQPELIPDHVAIRALMQTLRVSRNPDAAALKRIRARVDRVNLSDPDMEILVRELGAFDAPANAQQARIEAVRPSSARADAGAIARYVEEQRRFDSLIVDHYQQLLASLSQEGAAKLQEHLLHVKSRIKVYPTPDMSAAIDE